MIRDTLIPKTYMGMQLHLHPLVETIKEVPNRVPRSKSKRIRNKWRKKYGVREERIPGMFMMGDNLYLHPSLKPKLDKALEKYNRDMQDKRDELAFGFPRQCSTGWTKNDIRSAMYDVDSALPLRRRGRKEGLGWTETIYKEWCDVSER